MLVCIDVRCENITHARRSRASHDWIKLSRRIEGVCVGVVSKTGGSSRVWAIGEGISRERRMSTPLHCTHIPITHVPYPMSLYLLFMSSCAHTRTHQFLMSFLRNHEHMATPHHLSQSPVGSHTSKNLSSHLYKYMLYMYRNTYTLLPGRNFV